MARPRSLAQEPDARVPVGTRRSHRRALLAANGLAATLVVAGVLAQVLRPFAPDLGPPLDPGTWFDTAHLDRVAAYHGPRYAAGLLALLVRLAVPAALVFTPLGRRVVRDAVARWDRRPALAAAGVVLCALVATDLLLLPLAFWTGYVHDGAFGLRTQGLAGWAYDWLVARAPTWLSAAALSAAGYAVARRLPRGWPAVAGLAAAVLVVAAVALRPLLLEPLAFRLTPLPDGPVRTEVQRVLDAAGEEVDALFVADASRRTTRMNAYVSGLGATRRVVLYDTLVEGAEPAEVGLVVAHELAHRRHADVARGAAAGVAGAVVCVSVLAGVLRRRTRAGRQDGPGDPRGAAVALTVVVALTVASLPLQQALSRRAEAAADAVAIELSADPDTFRAAKLRLARENLGHPDPPVWAYLLWSSHPTPAERLTMGERWPRVS